MSISIEQLAEKINGKLWIKGDLKRIYLNDAGCNTKKMSTKTYVYQTENGHFGVSCYIDCPSQPLAWIKSQQDKVIEEITDNIAWALADTYYLMQSPDNPELYYNSDGKAVPLNQVYDYDINEEKMIELAKGEDIICNVVPMKIAEFEKAKGNETETEFRN